MTTETTVKVCRKCGEPKPTSEFYKESVGGHKPVGKFRAICKDCWNGKEPAVTDEERKNFVQYFVLNHLAEHGPTASLFFQHLLEHRYPKEISKYGVERAIFALVRSRKIISNDRLISGEQVNVLRLP